ncbi:MAG: putative lipid II flippase FtsW [Candidatus Sungbacteria bacterium]|uniref:Probable peptidoglycan glycosyltransferase FtsW n=1 Tax=Candidatus Sungiibacteriota bacterium TaxID=2750080 RepID=A0A933DU45_9BACT|nr:putative lipid II flippase FtsW [Candidatus Sungbacteria bacterium]
MRRNRVSSTLLFFIYPGYYRADGCGVSLTLEYSKMFRRIDFPLFVITLILVVAGLLVISSVSVVISQKNFGTPYYYLWQQGISALVGLTAFGFTLVVPYRTWRKWSLPILAVSLILLAAVFLPEFGFKSGGAQRWLAVGPINFQPSELVKFSLILYLASWLDKKKGHAKGFTSAFVPFLLLVGLVGALLVRQPDIGTLLVILGGSTILYFLGGGRIMQIAALVILAAVGLFAIVQVSPYRMDRFLVFLNPNFDPAGIGYHLNQALIAIGSGGFWGRGYGQSIQKYNYLPEPIGDSVFAVVVEEFGFLGGLILVALFFALFLRGMLIARRAPDFFGKLVAAGFTALITLQAFVNMAAISGFLPLTGIPLPFISYGGTSLVVTLAMIGIILNVSKHTS